MTQKVDNLDMKFISIILITVALIWTWNIVHNLPDSDRELHSQLQAQLKQTIAKSLLKTYPDASDLDFDRVWTERVNDKTVRATFSYSFARQADRHSLSGTAQLNQIDGQNWSLEVHVDQEDLEFSEGLEVSPGSPPTSE